jgi:poly-gamma-glutamate biosynthesis protein PgsC/CapC
MYELFFTGLLLSLLFVAVTGYFPGGMIVPGYLALYAGQPLRIIGTLVAALVAFLLYRLASRYLILFGRRRFVFLILSGALLSFGSSVLLPALFPAAIELKMIGWVIPGLIANQFDRQGVTLTVSSMAIVLVVLVALGRLYAHLF